MKQLFLLISSLILSQNLAESANNTCNDLPRECRFINYQKYGSMYSQEEIKNSINRQWLEDKFDGMICENRFDERMLRALGRVWSGCVSLQQSIVTVVVKAASGRQIVDESFGVFKLAEYFNHENTLQIFNLKGFDIESQINVSVNFKDIYFYSRFDLYKNNRLVKDCRDFEAANSRGFILHSIIFVPGYGHLHTLLYTLILVKPKSTHPICPLFFRNALIFQLSIQYLVKSYYMKNVIMFSNYSNTSSSPSLNSFITHLEIDQGYGIDLDSKLLNPEIFARTNYFTFTSHINLIEEDVFRPFTFEGIYFYSDNFIQLVRRQGIGWTKSINSNIRVDLSNLTAELVVEKYPHRSVRVGLIATRDNFLGFEQHPIKDADFCLFHDFPFEQLVFFMGDLPLDIRHPENKSSISCISVWLYQYNSIVFSGEISSSFDHQKLKLLIEECKFEERLSLCNKTNFDPNFEKTTTKKFSTFDFMLVFELTIMILAPLFGIFGMVTNLLTIYVILHKTNTKTLRKKQYVFVCLHCTCNSVICLIQLITLVNECQYPFGFYCSYVRQFVAVQYVKIVLGEYFNSVCRLLSNFTYLGFSLTRMSRLDTDNAAKLKISVKKFMIGCVLASAGLSVCKALQFDINLHMPEYASPLPFRQNRFRFGWMFKPGYVTITIINAVYDLINYFLFVIVHLFVDVLLVRKLRRLIRMKEEKMEKIKLPDAEKTQKENEASKRRVIYMVIINSLFNLITKVPSMITSLNDVRVLVVETTEEMRSSFNSGFFKFDPFRTDLTFRFFCSAEKSCVVFQSFGNCLFLASLCTIFYFLKYFDKNFQVAFRQLFPSKKNNKKTGLPIEIKKN